MQTAFTKLTDHLERWFSAPTPNAAENLGLYRILYGCWFLWIVAQANFRSLGNRPPIPDRPVGVFYLLDRIHWYPVSTNPREFFYIVEVLLAMALVLLIAGLATRAMTFAVLVLGLLPLWWDSSYRIVTDQLVLVGGIIPLMMLFSHWGDYFSLDSLIRKRSGSSRATLPIDSWEYSWPPRAILIFVSIYYFTAGVDKIRGSWLYNPYVLLDQIAGDAVQAWILGENAKSQILYLLSLKIAPLIMVSQYLALALELLFPVALVNRTLRTLVLSTTALFHLGTTVLMNIAFSPMIITVALYVDWARLFHRFWPERLRVTGIPSRWMLISLIGVTLIAAVAVGLTAANPQFSRFMRTTVRQDVLWFLISPFAAAAWIRSFRALLGQARRILVLKASAA